MFLFYIAGIWFPLLQGHSAKLSTEGIFFPCLLMIFVFSHGVLWRSTAMERRAIQQEIKSWF